MINKNLKVKKELIRIASKILQGKVSLIEGADLIDSLIDTTKNEFDFILPIKGIVSQADDIIREKYKLKGFIYIELIKYEADLKQYFDEVKSVILEVCEEIVKKFGNK